MHNSEDGLLLRHAENLLSDCLGLLHHNMLWIRGVLNSGVCLRSPGQVRLRRVRHEGTRIKDRPFEIEEKMYKSEELVGQE